MRQTAPAAPETDAKARIMAAARRLIAERGFVGVTVRDITDSAGVNTAAVNYYFRSKDELIRNVFEEGLKPVIAARHAALDACLSSAQGSVPTLAAVSEALIRPLVELSSGQYREVMLMLMHARSIATPTTAAVVVEQFAPVHERFVGVLHEILPELSREQIAFRYDCARGATLQILVDLAPAVGVVSGLNFQRAPHNDDLVADLTAFIKAGFAAPAASHSRRTAPAALC